VGLSRQDCGVCPRRPRGAVEVMRVHVLASVESKLPSYLKRS
jgi:hypothetical protein